MKIYEIISDPLKNKKQAKVVSDTNAQTILLDPDTNTKTIVDKQKNPKAFTKNDKGEVVYKQKENPKDISTASKLKPGQVIDVEDEDENFKK